MRVAAIEVTGGGVKERIAKQLAEGKLSCSFCSKTQREVIKLIAGPTVYICDECIGLCVEIINEGGGAPHIPLPTRADVVHSELRLMEPRLRRAIDAGRRALDDLQKAVDLLDEPVAAAAAPTEAP